MSKNVADQLVDILVEAGVKRIYAVTGDSLNQFNRSIKKNGKIQWIHVRHEEVGAFAASAEAQLDGIACCAGSAGPGHIHLINGLYEVNKTKVPVIVIASTCVSNEFGTDYFQETNTIKLFDDCSVYNQIATTPEQAPRMLQAAIQNAIIKKGVAVFGLPGNIEIENAVGVFSASKNFNPQSVIKPSDQELKQLAELLNSNKKITIFCGKGAANAHAEFLELAERLKAPIAYTFKSKMDIQYENPFEIGMTGLLGNPSAFKSMYEGDLLLMLGTDFPYDNFLPINKTIIQIDIRAEHIGRRARVDYGYCGNIKDTLDALLPLITTKEDDSFLKKQLATYQEVRGNLDIYVKDKGKENLIHPEYVVSVIDKLAKDDAVFSLDTGMSCVWGARYLNATRKRERLGSFNLGSMANAMPMAIGAALARSERQIIAFCGDGGISMLLGDLATIKQYNLPIKLFVFNNRALGMVKLEMEVEGIPDSETNMVNPDFKMIAEAMGLKGITISDPAKVEEGVKEALETKEAVLVNIMTDPNALALPPHIEWNQIKGMTIAMWRMMLGGNVKEVVDIVSSNIKHLKELNQSVNLIK